MKSTRRRIFEPADERPTIKLTAPRREVREYVRTLSDRKAAEAAKTFARTTLTTIEADATIDPERAADRLEAAAKRLAWTAGELRDRAG